MLGRHAVKLIQHSRSVHCSQDLEIMRQLLEAARRAAASKLLLFYVVSYENHGHLSLQRMLYRLPLVSSTQKET
jgi:hypothetical protein